MSNIIYAIFVLITLIFTALIAILIILIVCNYKTRKKINEIEMYKIHVNSQIDQNIPDLLDLIITESFNDYKIKSLAIKREEFINSDREVEIRDELTNIVSTRISPAAIEKLGLFYNTDNISDIIADKIYIAVVAYVVDHNNSFQSQ